jgi:hypothetical protein
MQAAGKTSGVLALVSCIASRPQIGNMTRSCSANSNLVLVLQKRSASVSTATTHRAAAAVATLLAVALAAPTPTYAQSTLGPDGLAGITNAPVAAAPAGLVNRTLATPPALAQYPYNTTRQVLVPPGWQMALWARVPEARLAAWAPDTALIVSRPYYGDVLHLKPRASDPAAPPAQTTLIEGLNQGHGVAFSNDNETLYVAESDQVSAYPYTNRAVGDPTALVADLPDSKSPDLHGQYAHALKSVAVDKRCALYSFYWAWWIHGYLRGREVWS